MKSIALALVFFAAAAAATGSLRGVVLDADVAAKKDLESTLPYTSWMKTREGLTSEEREVAANEAAKKMEQAVVAQAVAEQKAHDEKCKAESPCPMVPKICPDGLAPFVPLGECCKVCLPAGATKLVASLVGGGNPGGRGSIVAQTELQEQLNKLKKDEVDAAEIAEEERVERKRKADESAANDAKLKTAADLAAKVQAEYVKTVKKQAEKIQGYEVSQVAKKCEQGGMVLDTSHAGLGCILTAADKAAADKAAKAASDKAASDKAAADKAAAAKAASDKAASDKAAADKAAADAAEKARVEQDAAEKARKQIEKDAAEKARIEAERVQQQAKERVHDQLFSSSATGLKNEVKMNTIAAELAKFQLELTKLDAAAEAIEAAKTKLEGSAKSKEAKTDAFGKLKSAAETIVAAKTQVEDKIEEKKMEMKIEKMAAVTKPAAAAKAAEYLNAATPASGAAKPATPASIATPATPASGAAKPATPASIATPATPASGAAKPATPAFDPSTDPTTQEMLNACATQCTDKHGDKCSNSAKHCFQGDDEAKDILCAVKLGCQKCVSCMAKQATKDHIEDALKEKKEETLKK